VYFFVFKNCTANLPAAAAGLITDACFSMPVLMRGHRGDSGVGGFTYS